MNQAQETQKQIIEFKPKTTGWFIVYILFSLPGFILSSIFLIIVLFSLIAGIASGLTGVSGEESRFTFNTIQEGDSNNKILVYDLSGVIQTGDSKIQDSDRLNGIYTELVEKDFKRIKADESIKAVLFRVNTPGGTIFASEILGDKINNLIEAKGQEKAVYYYDSITASGGLWASYKTPNYIVGNQYGQTGSIGVLVTLPNFKGVADNIGYSETTIKSSEAKDIGNPFREINESEKEYFQEIVDKRYEDFLDIVANGRGLEKQKVREFANGLIYENEEAKDFGLIDEIGNLDMAIKKTAEIKSVSDYEVVEIQTKIGFADTFFARGFVADLMGLPKQAQTLQERGEIIEPGKTYVIDEYRI